MKSQLLRFPALPIAVVALLLPCCKKESAAPAPAKEAASPEEPASPPQPTSRSAAPAAKEVAREVEEAPPEEKPPSFRPGEGPKPLPKDPTWKVDFREAQREARNTNKDLMLDFTGSDWSINSMLLDREVYHTQAFRDLADEFFVRVRLDYPNDKSLIAPEEITQNAELALRYENASLGGLPLVYLCDPEGRPYGVLGYIKGGPVPWLTKVLQLRDAKAQRDYGLEEAKKLEGMEKVAALFEVLKALNLPEDIVTKFYPEIFDEIKKHDPEDKTGIRRREKTKALMAGLQGKVRPLVAQKKLMEAVAEFDGFLKNNALDKENTQVVMLSKARVYGELGKPQEGIRVLDDAIKVAPASRVAKKCAELKSDYLKKAIPVKTGN